MFLVSPYTTGAAQGKHNEIDGSSPVVTINLP
jgi:hypothetical protein